MIKESGGFSHENLMYEDEQPEASTGGAGHLPRELRRRCQPIEAQDEMR